jgi:hypothetical protein
MQQQRYSELCAAFAEWLSTANTEVDPVVRSLASVAYFLYYSLALVLVLIVRQSTLGGVLDIAQTVAFRSPQYDELRHLSSVLFGSDDIRTAVRTLSLFLCCRLGCTFDSGLITAR